MAQGGELTSLNNGEDNRTKVLCPVPLIYTVPEQKTIDIVMQCLFRGPKHLTSKSVGILEGRSADY